MLINQNEIIDHVSTNCEWEMDYCGEVFAVVETRIPHDAPNVADAHITYTSFSKEKLDETDADWDRVVEYLNEMGVDTIVAPFTKTGKLLNKWIKYVEFLGFEYLGLVDGVYVALYRI